MSKITVSNRPDRPPREIGYMRVSTHMQDHDLQRRALNAAGIGDELIFEDTMTGARMDRPGLQSAIQACWPGDTIVVWKIDRLGRSVIGVLQALERLSEKGINVRSLTEPLDTQTPVGRLILTFLLSLAQLEREMIAERTKAGIAAKKARGEWKTKAHSVMSHPKRDARFRELWNSGELFAMTGAEVVKELNAADPRNKAPLDPNKLSWFFNWKNGNKKRGIPAWAGFVPDTDEPISD